jgi:hypothetical protein
MCGHELMLMQPLRSNASRRQTSTVKFVPPPIKGWNAKDDQSDMDQDEAIVLDNLIPSDTGVFMRKGFTEWVTGIGSAIKSLMEYNAPTGSAKLFAATSSAVYDVSSSGAVGAAALSSLSNGYWQHLMFATSGGTFLVMCNGADAVRNYNGSAWSTPSITGVTSANLITVTAHQSRLWFIEENTMKVWYLPALSIAGAATSIDFGGLSRLGGKLMAMATWTRDSGSGIEDLAAFITSRGEVHIYSGSDPSSSATWERVGTFKISEPIGRRCLIKVGGDVGIITSQGVVPLAGILSRAESAQGKVAITDRIRNAFTLAYNQASTAQGWQCVEYPVGKLLILNVPVAENTTSVQFVMNANTGAWCRFTGINTSVWSLKGAELFFGGVDGTVYKYEGNSDNGVSIDGTSVSAFTDFGTPMTKCFKRIRPQFFGPSGYRPSIALRLDYSEDYRVYNAAAYVSSGTVWDDGDWDTSSWASPSQSSALWQGITGEGFTAAIVVKLSSEESMTYNGAKILYETGDQL